MKKFYLLIFALALLWAPSCDGPQGSPEQIAREACRCMEPLASLYSQMREALEENDLERLDALAEAMEQTSESVEQCAQAVEDKYGHLEGEREQEVKAAMQKTCPEIIATLNEAESELVQ